jgi:hypothetical protein
MDDDTKNQNLEVSPEEATLEEEAQQEVKDEELREDLAEKFGLDPDEQGELLDKIVEREKANREKLSGAIKQKISWREKYQTFEKPKEKPEGGEKPNKQEIPDIDKLVDQKLTERLEARELETLDLSDDLKAEVKDLARLKGISVREAAQLPYIQSRREEIEREQRIQAATPKRSKKGSFVSNVDPSKPLDPEDFKTSDGNIDVEAWNEAKAARQKHLSSQN